MVVALPFIKGITKYPFVMRKYLKLVLVIPSENVYCCGKVPSNRKREDVEEIMLYFDTEDVLNWLTAQHNYEKTIRINNSFVSFLTGYSFSVAGWCIFFNREI